MATDTKERIPAAALELFAKNGYLGTSMRDIAAALGMTKAALYKHYAGKEEILAAICRRMQADDAARAADYAMPGDAAAYLYTPSADIRAYTKAQFLHWTAEPFAAAFRRMLTLEQYRDAEMAQLYRDYLAAGPLEYMAAIFRRMTDTDEGAMQLALEFYGPMFLLYSVYDEAADKAAVVAMLDAHIDRFVARLRENRDAEHAPRACENQRTEEIVKK